MRKLLATLPISGVAALALITLLWPGLLSTSDSAHAQAGPIVLGIDMDVVNKPANSCPGDGVTDCTLGSIQNCQRVSANQGTTFKIDAFVDDLWQGHGGFSWDLDFPDTASGAKLTMTNQIPDPIAGGNNSINLILQSTGSGPLVDVSEAVPDLVKPHAQGVTDSGTDEATPPYTQGTEVRYYFTVGAGAVPGTYGFSFVPGTYEVLDQFGVGYSGQGAGITILDANSTPQYGILALGVPCPGLAVGGIAELADVAGSSTPNYIALAALVAAALVAVGAGGWYARRRLS